MDETPSFPETSSGHPPPGDCSQAARDTLPLRPQRAMDRGVRSTPAPSERAAETAVNDALSRFLWALESNRLPGSNPVPAARVVEHFVEFQVVLNERAGARCSLGHECVARINRRVAEGLLPHVASSAFAERMLSKPLGYAGDYLTIEQIYSNQPTGRGLLGALMDRCFLESPAACAVRNRRPLLAGESVAAARACSTRPARVTSMGSGPAREVSDAFSLLSDPAGLEVTLLDIDPAALRFVHDRSSREGWRPHARLRCENLVRVATGRTSLDLRPQDLIYSVGLIDYLPDGLVVRLLDRIAGLLGPGGRVVLGNFHPRNPTRAMMDHLLDWRLIHRTEEEMAALFQASRFGRAPTRVFYEPQGINLFAECVL